MREYRLSIVRDNDRARRDAETDDERQHRLSRMRERDRTKRDSEKPCSARKYTTCTPGIIL